MGAFEEWFRWLGGRVGGGLPLTAAQREHWLEKGYLVLPRLFADDALAAVEQEVLQQWERSRHQPSEVVIDLIDCGRVSRRIHLHDAPTEARLRPHRLNDLFLVSDVVRDVILAPQLASVIGQLLGGTPLVCNSLNFAYGSQQSFHTDSLYVTPSRGLNMAASWIALEECVPEAGPLRFYPGSHRIPPYRFSNGRLNAVASELGEYKQYMETQVRALGLIEQRFCAKPGDVLIWHSQLYHGGAPVKDISRTRRSLVSHYFLARDLPFQRKVRHASGGYWMRRPHQAVM